MKQEDDHDLREGFAALREADASLDPGYARVRGRRSAPRRKSRFPRRTVWPGLAIGGGLAAAALALLVVRPPTLHVAPSGLEDASVPAGLGQWAMPTDALLDLSGLPGDTLLREMPELGTWRDPTPTSNPGDVPDDSSQTTLFRTRSPIA